MSATAIEPFNKMKSTITRWNSIMVSDHRRSRSLPHKSASTEAMRSSISLSALRSREDEQLMIRTASTKTSAIAEEVDNSQLPISPSRSNHSRQSSNASPPPRPRPAPRLWKDHPSSSSLRGLETAIAPGHTHSPTQSSQQITTIPVCSSPAPESPKSIVSKFSTWKEKSFAGRRKGSIPDLTIASDSIRPFSPDSPTLPTIQSARTPSTVLTGSITPRPFSCTSEEPTSYSALKTPEYKERDNRRASSMLLPQDLAPIVIPSVPHQIPPVPQIDTTVTYSGRFEEFPPRPPPKSPRTLLRAFPTPKSTIESGRHTASSSIDSISPIDTPSTDIAAWSPVTDISVSTSFDSFSSSPSKRTNKVQFDEPRNRLSSIGSPSKTIPKHSRSISTPQTESVAATRHRASPALGNHSRMVSESSVMNRGRPTKPKNLVPQQQTDPTPNLITPSSYRKLPQGLRPGQTTRIPVDELCGLRRDAEELASSYRILTQTQISGLNKEQQLIDESCGRIANTILGLKQARQATFLSLKQYLQAPTTTAPARDYILKQSKILNDIDAQIDGWQSRLDAATDRKLGIQSKVWEHLAAILTAVSMAAEVGHPEDYTPPRSPERVVRRSLTEDPIIEDGIINDQEKTIRNEVESITVYADSGVANLLRSIEEELDVIDQSRYYDRAIMA